MDAPRRTDMRVIRVMLRFNILIVLRLTLASVRVKYFRYVIDPA